MADFMNALMRIYFSGPPAQRIEPTVSGETAHQAGLKAVERATSPASTEGRRAVADAVKPADIRAMIDAMMRSGWASPEESAAWAQAVGQNAVGSAAEDQRSWWRNHLRQLGTDAVAGGISGPMPITPPGAPFGPQEVTPPGYASGATRAKHYGPRAVEQELLGKEEQE